MPEATDWSELTADEQTALVTSPFRLVEAGCELLNPDLTGPVDITDDLDPSGTVQWNGDATVHRGCTINLTRELAWGSALLRLYAVLTDPTGLRARRNLGVFCPTQPDTQLGQTVIDPVSGPRLAFAVTGQDRLYLLNRQVGYSLAYLSATPVFDVLADVFARAGLVGFLIDSTAAAKSLPTDMAWPLLPTGDDTSDPVTWLRVVNDLLDLINYRGVWADENGYFRCEPYVNPSDRAASFAFDSDSKMVSTVSVDRTVSRSPLDVPNKWTFVWSNMPDVSGVPQTPSVANGGLYVVTNTSDGLSSIDARNGLEFPTQIPYTAASAADLIAQGDVKVAADKRTTATAKVSVVPFPALSHYDVFTWRDAALVPEGGEWKTQVSGWTYHLDGSDSDVDWERVS